MALDKSDKSSENKSKNTPNSMSIAKQKKKKKARTSTRQKTIADALSICQNDAKESSMGQSEVGIRKSSRVKKLQSEPAPKTPVSSLLFDKSEKAVHPFFLNNKKIINQDKNAPMASVTTLPSSLSTTIPTCLLDSSGPTAVATSLVTSSNMTDLATSILSNTENAQISLLNDKKDGAVIPDMFLTKKQRQERLKERQKKKTEEIAEKIKQKNMLSDQWAASLHNNSNNRSINEVLQACKQKSTTILNNNKDLNLYSIVEHDFDKNVSFSSSLGASPAKGSSTLTPALLKKFKSTPYPKVERTRNEVQFQKLDLGPEILKNYKFKEKPIAEKRLLKNNNTSYVVEKKSPCLCLSRVPEVNEDEILNTLINLGFSKTWVSQLYSCYLENHYDQRIFQQSIAPARTQVPIDDTNVNENVSTDHLRHSLWTEKYRPISSKFVIGNTTETQTLKAWLEAWKLTNNNIKRIKKMKKMNKNERREKRKIKKIELKERYRHKNRTSFLNEKDEHEVCSDDEFDEYDQYDVEECHRINENFYEESSTEESDSDRPKRSRKTKKLLKCFLLTGPIGSCKTASLYACAEELGYNVLELNAGNLRSGKAITTAFLEATQSHQLAKSSNNDLLLRTRTSLASNSKKEENLKTLTLVLFEDVDIIFEEHDKGFWAAINTLAETTKRPIVFTSNEKSITSIPIPTSLRYFHRDYDLPTMSDLALHTTLIALAEKQRFCPYDLLLVINLFKNDIRHVLTNLQYWAQLKPPSATNSASHNDNDYSSNSILIKKIDPINQDKDDSVPPDCGTGGVVFTSFISHLFDLISPNPTTKSSSDSYSFVPATATTTTTITSVSEAQNAQMPVDDRSKFSLSSLSLSQLFHKDLAICDDEKHLLNLSHILHTCRNEQVDLCWDNYLDVVNYLHINLLPPSSAPFSTDIINATSSISYNEPVNPNLKSESKHSLGAYVEVNDNASHHGGISRKISESDIHTTDHVIKPGMNSQEFLHNLKVPEKNLDSTSIVQQKGTSSMTKEKFETEDCLPYHPFMHDTSFQDQQSSVKICKRNTRKKRKLCLEDESSYITTASPSSTTDGIIPCNSTNKDNIVNEKQNNCEDWIVANSNVIYENDNETKGLLCSEENDYNTLDKDNDNIMNLCDNQNNSSNNIQRESNDHDDCDDPDDDDEVDDYDLPKISSRRKRNKRSVINDEEIENFDVKHNALAADDDVNIYRLSTNEFKNEAKIKRDDENFHNEEIVDGAFICKIKESSFIGDNIDNEENHYRKSQLINKNEDYHQTLGDINSTLMKLKEEKQQVEKKCQEKVYKSQELHHEGLSAAMNESKCHESRDYSTDGSQEILRGSIPTSSTTTKTTIIDPQIGKKHSLFQTRNRAPEETKKLSFETNNLREISEFLEFLSISDFHHSRYNEEACFRYVNINHLYDPALEYQNTEDITFNNVNGSNTKRRDKIDDLTISLNNYESDHSIFGRIEDKSIGGKSKNLPKENNVLAELNIIDNADKKYNNLGIIDDQVLLLRSLNGGDDRSAHESPDLERHLDYCKSYAMRHLFRTIGENYDTSFSNNSDAQNNDLNTTNNDTNNNNSSFNSSNRKGNKTDKENRNSGNNNFRATGDPKSPFIEDKTHSNLHTGNLNNNTNRLAGSSSCIDESFDLEATYNNMPASAYNNDSLLGKRSYKHILTSKHNFPPHLKIERDMLDDARKEIFAKQFFAIQDVIRPESIMRSKNISLFEQPAVSLIVRADFHQKTSNTKRRYRHHFQQHLTSRDAPYEKLSLAFPFQWKKQEQSYKFMCICQK